MKFISRYSNNKEVTPAQYITELICEKKAKLDNEDLHYKFWTTKKWSKFYRDQIATANKLVKNYDPVVIVKALNHKKAKTLYSLRAPFLKDILKEEQMKFDTQNKTLTKKLERNKEVTFSKTKVKKNIISKLKELDNE
jgi:hypothetical protein